MQRSQSDRRRATYLQGAGNTREAGMQSADQRNDAALVTRLCGGDQNAMADLYERYSGIVYGVALRVLGDTTAAEDVLQEIFLQLWRRPQAYNADRGGLAPWLAVIARNRAIDVLRKRPPEEDLNELPVAVGIDLEDVAAQRLAVEKVRRAIAQLPQEQRNALEMAFFEGLTHSEIANKTGEPLGTVKTRIRSALMAVRKAVA
jgi:RNA polymerase sigma-70 factor (ECF subfamily)